MGWPWVGSIVLAVVLSAGVHIAGDWVRKRWFPRD